MLRRLSVIPAAAAIALAPVTGAHADGSGPQNQVVAQPTTDNASAARARLQVVPFAGATNNSQNAAIATPHDCTNCKGVAIAMQAVITTGKQQSSSPGNYAIAVNSNCHSCIAAAWARQVIVATGSDHPVELTDDARYDLQNVRRQLDELAHDAQRTFAGIDQSSDRNASLNELDTINAQVDKLWSRVMNDVCSPQDYEQPSLVQNLTCGVTPASNG